MKARQSEKFVKITEGKTKSNVKVVKASSLKKPNKPSLGRRNHRITKNKGRKQDTPKRTFMKRVEIVITGTDVEAIKKTVQDIYSLQNDYTSGGKDKRIVQITRMDSSDVETIFYGRH